MTARTSSGVAAISMLALVWFATRDTFPPRSRALRHTAYADVSRGQGLPQGPSRLREAVLPGHEDPTLPTHRLSQVLVLEQRTDPVRHVGWVSGVDQEAGPAVLHGLR